MAVAIFSRPPTADELLDRRIKRGWRPTLSSVQGGNRVLGHAAGWHDENGPER